MNVNCNADPLTCRCDYHAGYVRPSPKARLGFEAEVQRRMLEMDLSVRAELRQMRGAHRKRAAVRVGKALLLLVGAAAIMHAEGLRTGVPGFGFAVAGAMMGAAVLLIFGARDES